MGLNTGRAHMTPRKTAKDVMPWQPIRGPVPEGEEGDRPSISPLPK
jgi:hypothetical protein